MSSRLSTAPFSRRYAQKLAIMCQFGNTLAELSTCKRAQNGCVLFSMNCTSVWSIGYNGPARGLPNNACTDEEGNCGCVHAEANAIATRCEREWFLVYSSTMPCHHCASLLVNTGCCAGVLYKRLYRDANGLKVIEASHIHHMNSETLQSLHTGDDTTDEHAYDMASHIVAEWQARR